MSDYGRARAYVAAFRSDADDPNLSLGEAELRDLALLRDAVDEVIAVHVRELVAFEGLSWAAVAAAIAPSPASLRLRYGHAKSE
ncbi:hypothetical protein M3T53_00475 [Actinomyces sp. B33]|uniref:hypothetical protein n=1 Tax=Actinomyces sp. B33 TaxID=2942131 RepID=UPI0023420B48|nr:hypothetical protein [Actinomyces sp. B33]MDC4232193.1 hypothetical protein [Actinomyces sp. B33]